MNEHNTISPATHQHNRSKTTGVCMDAYSNDHWLELLLNLSHYIDSRISPAGTHSARVAHWSRLTASLLNCSEEEVRKIDLAAKLHDVGKIGVPEKVLAKAGPLTEQEWVLIKLHPVVGGNIVRATHINSGVDAMILCHQEKFDGTGYPFGLRGREIPLGARILAVVDAYDAMTNDRVYRRARSHEEAIHELRTLEGQHFDPEIVRAFFEVVKSNPSGNGSSRNGKKNGSGG